MRHHDRENWARSWLSGWKGFPRGLPTRRSRGLRSDASWLRTSADRGQPRSTIATNPLGVQTPPDSAHVAAIVRFDGAGATLAPALRMGSSSVRALRDADRPGSRPTTVGTASHDGGTPTARECRSTGQSRTIRDRAGLSGKRASGKTTGLRGTRRDNLRQLRASGGKRGSAHRPSSTVAARHHHWRGGERAAELSGIGRVPAAAAGSRRDLS